MAFFGRAALSDVPLRHGSRERSTMRKLLLAGIMTLALPVAAFAQTSGTADTTAAPAATAHKTTHHAHHRAHTAKHAKKHAHRKASSTTAAPSSNPVN
ncbi:hypothetical protein [Inquilinus sp.]|uniref:hypothetical protein n=1 Tax=Inquilinus sp. TaxID=1932117 RepID=UPI0031CE59BD